MIDNLVKKKYKKEINNSISHKRIMRAYPRRIWEILHLFNQIIS